MSFHSHVQKKAYQKALQDPLKAVAFDVDGTLTHFSRFIIPRSLAEVLVQIPPHIPRAICTGRELQFIHSQLKHICSHAENPQEERKRWVIFLENGALAYEWDEDKQDYKSFLEVPWPEPYQKEEMQAVIKKHMRGRGSVGVRDYTLVVLNPRWAYFFPNLTKLLSKRNHARLETLFRKRGWDKAFSVQNSGIGNVILSKESGKGNAMQHWAKHLKIRADEILVVGDQPRLGGNDADFLNGRNGTPFTVGELTHEDYPFPVHDAKGHRLQGPEGTKALLGQVTWST